MGFTETLDATLQGITPERADPNDPLYRACSELRFAARIADLHSAAREDWQTLVLRAAERLRDRSGSDPEGAAAEAEAILSPVGAAAKEYTIHCCGHAHIDMNWTWPLYETVSVCHDTFLTVDRLMREYPDFHYSQPQVTVYSLMEEYCPEVFETVAGRIREGRWEPVVSQWLEGDKNMASGESLCRHILYAKRYMRERFGLPEDSQRIAWEGDTFGHPISLPAILSRGGVTRYYHCRAGAGHWLAWWQSPDGSRVLEFNDKNGYGGGIGPWVGDLLVEYVAETGLKDFLYIYGVVDHGGGPTRMHLKSYAAMQSWPIFPRLRLSTTDAYFTAVEREGDRIRVYDGELNTVFEGCYTSQSKAKLANRAAENLLPEAETAALLAGATVAFDYPAEDFRRAWQHALFIQFHDILAGSSGHAAMEEAVQRWQQVEAIAGSVRMRALRKLAGEVNTASLTSDSCGDLGDTVGYGAGDVRVPGGLSAWDLGAAGSEPVVVYNPLPFARSEMVVAKLWNRDFGTDDITVRDDRGNVTSGQVIGESRYNEHHSVDILFPAADVPGVGYHTLVVERGRAAAEPGVRVPAPGVLENAFLRVEVDPASGAIRRLTDRTKGREYVAPGGLMGVLELLQEAPHGMTAWEIGQIVESRTLTTGGTLIDESDPRDSLDGDSLGMVTSTRVQQNGPHRACVRTLHRIGQSRVAIEIGLASGSRSVDVRVVARWREVGTPETGVPMLRMAFATATNGGRATYEVPFGSIERPANGREVPALRWADLSDAQSGVTLVNDCKYGHSAEGSVLRVTLLRSSYDPDPLPEVGLHHMRFAIVPHDGPCSVDAAMRAAAALNQPLAVITTDFHAGPLPTSDGYVELLTPNVALAALKRSEDTDAVIVRLYETGGRDVEARVRLTRLVAPGSCAVETDLLERPLATNAARMEGDTLVVRMPAHGIVSVAVGELPA